MTSTKRTPKPADLISSGRPSQLRAKIAALEAQVSLLTSEQSKSKRKRRGPAPRRGATASRVIQARITPAEYGEIADTMADDETDSAWLLDAIRRKLRALAAESTRKGGAR